MEILFLADAKKLHATLYDAFRSIAITVADAVGERTMVYADADSSMVLLADIEERNESFLNLLEFVGIFLVGIFLLDKLAGRIHVVAWVDTHLFAIECSHISHIRIEVDVSHERSGETIGTDSRIDILHVFSLAGALGGKAHQFATSLDDFLCLTYTSLGIIGIGSGHRLDADRIVTA